MGMDIVLQILQWAIPSGGIGAAIAWIVNRKARSAKVAKEVHDTYKTMYEDVSHLLLETQKKYEETIQRIDDLGTENIRIKRGLDRLSRAIEAIQTCPYRASCPVYRELPDEGSSKRKGGKRSVEQRKQPGGKQPVRDGAGDISGSHSDGDDELGDTDGKPPRPA